MKMLAQRITVLPVTLRNGLNTCSIGFEFHQMNQLLFGVDTLIEIKDYL